MSLTVIAMVVALIVSKPIYVVDSDTDFSKFMADRASNWSTNNRKLEEDDGGSDASDEPQSLNNNPFHCVCDCKCPLCPGDGNPYAEDADSDDYSGEHQHCGEVGPSNHVVKPTEFVKELHELRMKTEYCIISKLSDKVIKLRTNKYLYQENFFECEKGSRFVLTDLERKDDHIITKIYDKEQNFCLYPQNPVAVSSHVWGTENDEDDYTQKWKIVPNRSHGIDEGFFHIESLISNRPWDVNANSQAVAYIMSKNATYLPNQTFSFKVMGKVKPEEPNQ